MKIPPHGTWHRENNKRWGYKLLKLLIDLLAESNATQSLRHETESVFLSSCEGRVVRGEERGASL